MAKLAQGPKGANSQRVKKMANAPRVFTRSTVRLISLPRVGWLARRDGKFWPPSNPMQQPV